ncbi:hypothetical protein XELAEV_18033386mg [Xenopus laevis]|uniref:Uncharacterized protein n=1 Tax=Xenopus laevis TaxID=8355 RepID=A0A974CJ58_XENLA|nr:hypothetical protein XELAEV_18033386mg [Xenopus laevis]
MDVLMNTFKSALFMDRTNLINGDRTNKAENLGVSWPLTFSMSYNVQFDKIGCIINKYLPVLHVDRDFKEIFDCGFRAVERKAPILGSILAPKSVY